MEFVISEMLPEDWPQVSAIYAEGIGTGNATFETTVPDWGHWDAVHLRECRWVAKKGDQILGWAALSPVSNRCVYAGVAEVSIYVGENWRGKMVGSALLEKLVQSSETMNIWTLQAGIFPENLASLRLHQKAGFRLVGRRERIGQLKGTWRDTLLLERRSQVVGG